MQITERQTTLGLLGLLTIGALLNVVIDLINIQHTNYLVSSIISLFVCGALLFFYWRGAEIVRPIAALLIASMLPLLLIGQPLGDQIQIPVFITPAIALVLGGPILVISAAVISYGGLILLAGFPSVYTQPYTFLVYSITIGAIVLSRLMLDSALSRSRSISENLVAKQHEVEAALALAEARTVELSQAVEKQRHLLETVTQLGAPLLPVRSDVLVLPIIGHVDTDRLERLTRLLLEGVATRRTRFVILDVTGLDSSASSIIGLLVQTATAVELLGATVSLAGISAEIAQALIEQQITLGRLQTFRDLERALDATIVARDTLRIGTEAHTPRAT